MRTLSICYVQSTSGTAANEATAWIITKRVYLTTVAMWEDNEL